MNNQSLNQKICFSWIEDFLTHNSTSLAEMNALFTERHIGGITFVSILLIFGFFGNLAVIWIFSAKFNASNYRTYTLWLAFIDMVNCCLGLPFSLFYLTHYITFPSALYCKMGRFILVFTANASAFILLFIAKERYNCVSKPIRNHSVKHVSQIPCVFCIIFAFLVSWPTLVLYGDHTMDTLPFGVKGNRCWMEDKYKDTNFLSTFYITLSVLSFIVTVTLIVAYSLILRNIFKEDRLFTRLISSYYTSEHVGRTRNNRKTTFTLLAVTLAYLLSALPHNVLIVFLLLKKDLQCNASYVHGVIIYIFGWSILVNNAVNPIIYGFSDSRFRNELQKIFKTCWHKGDRATEDTKI